MEKRSHNLQVVCVKLEGRKSIRGVEAFNFQLLSLGTNRSMFVTDQPVC